MNSAEQIDCLLTKLDLDDKTVAEDALARLTKFLPASLRMMSAIKMYTVFKVPGLDVYQPKRKDFGCENIWFVVQAADLSFTENSVGIFCQDSPKELEQV